MAMEELSMSVGRLKPRHPLRHMTALPRGAKLTLVRIYVIASEYDSFFFSAILLASCSIVRVAEGPAPQRKAPFPKTVARLLFRRQFYYVALLGLKAFQRILLRQSNLVHACVSLVVVMSSLER